MKAASCCVSLPSFSARCRLGHGAGDAGQAARESSGNQTRVGTEHAARWADLVSEKQSHAQGELTYTATAGTLLRPAGATRALRFITPPMWSKAANRPLTFGFNGGPGAASAYLHLGLVGPRILELGPDGHDAARATLRDNPERWPRFTDLVMIFYPIGTAGAAPPRQKMPRAWSVNSDAATLWRRRSRFTSRTTAAAARRILLGELTAACAR